MACKPDFVQGLTLWTAIHLGLLLPTGSCNQPGPAGAKAAPDASVRAIPIWSCSRWGLPCQPCCQRCGGLLPHLFTLTQLFSGKPESQGRSVFCGAFPLVAQAGRYPAPLLFGVRTFLTPKGAAAQPSASCCTSASQGGGSRPAGVFLCQSHDRSHILPRQRTDCFGMKA